MESPATTQDYYDRFSENYERERHHGYHRLIDDLEIDLVRRHGTGRHLFEAGCGTGLLLREAASFARTATGLDLSRGMLGSARRRNLRVVQGSVTDIPLPDACMDVVYSMKVLPHVPLIERALAEFARIVRPGGTLLLEFYNPLSLRYLAKRLTGPAAIAVGTTDRDVFTRYDTVTQAKSYLPAGVTLESVRGVRILTPTSLVYRVPALGRLFSRGERLAADIPGLRNLGGFLILVARKAG